MESFILLCFMAAKLADRKETKTMRMQTKLSIVTVVGAGALLLIALAVIIAPRPQTAHAQNDDPPPPVVVRLSTGSTITQGDQLFAQYEFNNFQSLTCNKHDGNSHSTAFDDPCYYRGELLPGTDTSESDATMCEGSTLGPNRWRSFSQGDGIKRVIGYSNNRIPTNCPPGDYTLKVYLAGSDRVAVEESIDSDGYFKVEAVPPTAIPTNTRPPTATRTPRPPSPPPTADRHPNFDADSNIDADNNADRNAYS